MDQHTLKLRNEQLEQENELMRRIYTRGGFYEYYFEMLRTEPTRKEAFEKVNEQFFELFGEYRYADYNSFRHQLKIWLENQSK